MAKILILDDDADLQEVYALILSQDHHDVKAMLNADNILGEVEKYKPDVILLDVSLKGEDGRNVCKQIKEHNKSIPILLISATNKYLVGLNDCEADGAIEKPFEMSVFINTINKLLK